MNTCNGCKYWKGINGNEAMGQCRQEPPKPVFPAVPMDARQLSEPRWVFGSAVWPVTKHEDWCGSHQPAIAIASNGLLS